MLIVIYAAQVAEAVKATGEYPERVGEPACQVYNCVMIDCNTLSELVMVDNLSMRIPGRSAYKCYYLACIL